MADHDYIVMSNKYKDGKVRLTSAWSDWKLAMVAFREELNAIDKALKGPSSKASRGPTHDEFASHLLDVHRIWCDACPLPPGGRGVRPDRDAGGSAVVIDPKKRNIYVSTATQTTYGMYGLDMGVLDDVDDNDEILSMTCHGEDEGLLVDVRRCLEKPSNERGGIPSTEISHTAPGPLHEGNIPHQLNLDTEGCINISSPSASGEANGNKSQRNMDVNTKSLTLNDTTCTTKSLASKYSCSVCGKRFGRSGHLTRHMLLHAAVRPVHCPICNKAFARKELLALHMETSTHGSGPQTRASCFVCNKTFSMDILARHMRSHTKERPHRCDPCGKLFLKREHLLLHMQTHRRKEPFQCSICDQTFPVQANLDMHHYLAHTLGENDRKTEPSSVIEVTFQ